MATTSVLVSLDIVALGDLLDIFAVLEDIDLTDWFNEDQIERKDFLYVKFLEYYAELKGFQND